DSRLRSASSWTSLSARRPRHDTDQGGSSSQKRLAHPVRNQPIPLQPPCGFATGSSKSRWHVIASAPHPIETAGSSTLSGFWRLRTRRFSAGGRLALLPTVGQLPSCSLTRFDGRQDLRGWLDLAGCLLRPEQLSL